MDPAAADPGVQGDGRHGELGGQVVQPPLVGAGCFAGRRDDALAGDRPGTAELVEELGDGADPDALVSLGRAEALGVQPVGDGLGAVALLGQLADPLDQLRVGAELVEAGDGADGLATGGVPAGPGDLDGDAFAGASNGDGDLVHHGADELLAVGVGGGWRGPQAFDVAGQGGEGLGASAGEAVVVLPQLLLDGQRGFPVGFQLAHDQAVLRLGQPIAAPRPVSVELGALQTLRPELVEFGSLGLDLLGGAQRDRDPGRGQGRQDLLGDQHVDAGPGQGLAALARTVVGQLPGADILGLG